MLVIAEAFERYLTGDTTPVIDITDLAASNPVAVATIQEGNVVTLTKSLETPSFVFRFSDGALHVESGGARDVDCRISADPAALLPVHYKRRSQWSAIARGRLMAFGRRPWLAFGLKDRFGGF